MTAKELKESVTQFYYDAYGQKYEYIFSPDKFYIFCKQLCKEQRQLDEDCIDLLDDTNPRIIKKKIRENKMPEL